MGHSYDILFFELFKVGFWWLPTAWLIGKEIKKIHEYQADAYALKSSEGIALELNSTKGEITRF
jgi:beta-lactamase regulating signal transducer with metallopeptidase domain